MTAATHRLPHPGPSGGLQLSFDELAEPLRDITFVVVDLETTGGAAASDAITEVGAVKVRGGQVLGEFQTLVDPRRSIPAFVSVLTGITDTMVVSAPTISSVVPAFLEFARGAILVAHNAPFDIGFLKAACTELALPWPGPAVVDTAVLARRVLTRDEVPNCKLATLAPFFRATTRPTHRALDDARATVDVLHGLLERLGNLGVHSLPELRAFTAQVSEAQRRKRHLAEGLPARPGVYVFRDAKGTPLYVGTSRNLRSRVRQYFVASETRSRMGEMVGLAERVDPIECAHTLEAQVRELRLIAAHKPRYNRRSKFPERAVWLKLTVEPFPRLSVVREARDDGASYLGPLRNQRQAEVVRDAIHDAVPLRQCSDRLSLRRVVRAACVLAGIGRCDAPCEGGTTPQQYAALVGLVASAWTGDVRPLVAPLEARIAALSAAQRYEQAGVVRDRITTVVRACARMQRLSAVRAVGELVAARPDGHGGWELVVVRAGRLAAAGVAARGVPPWPVVDALRATADVVDPSHAPLAEETECILRWLEQDGTRLVDASAPWAMPAFGAGRMSTYLAADHPGADPFRDRRRLPMAARPARATVTG
ncbi:DNA polymerase-3 subunit epsilon [Jatrophihabitans endophyticus]|uniref:DNA polymerase-3 subunit epsilon n=1 Tax=Jatrophihabitans endophyticus TaxID=1206085 RepID=A0A1M5L390_9ACTN|nr:DEDD exonuclease domain-containing protein [Jatrophihabitans endophyticus]SHG59410.1 DNA polymerase-3 subunit epsilon [Jatrophihabitans endophyticus]